MVFSNLRHDEKEAFFSLLDEYFSSRPDVFANVGGSSGTRGLDTGAAASAIHRAFTSRSSPPSAAAATPESEVDNVAGRVAAASLAFSARNNDQPPPARSPPPVAQKPSPPAGLVSSRKFGDVDTSSTKGMISSVYNSRANKNAPFVPPPAPSAFPQKKNAFAPPPVRRASSSTSVTPPPLPQRQPSPPEEEEAQGEWAEALYDYDSSEPGDLNIKANQRVLVTEQTSDDWWTGEFNGQKGLFPASYVKLL